MKKKPTQISQPWDFCWYYHRSKHKCVQLFSRCSALQSSCQLQVGRALEFLLSRSDFKSKTGFCIPQPKLHEEKYLIFCKTAKHAHLTSRHKRSFAGGFRHKTGPLSSNPFFSESGVYYKRNSSC